jgi:hypothetical protein
MIYFHLIISSSSVRVYKKYEYFVKNNNLHCSFDFIIIAL